jgi:hypothetical protein
VNKQARLQDKDMLDDEEEESNKEDVVGLSTATL